MRTVGLIFVGVGSVLLAFAVLTDNIGSSSSRLITGLIAVAGILYVASQLLLVRRKS